MSAGQPGDWQATMALVQKRIRCKNRVNWLRHGEGTQATLIDEMLLDGTHSLEEMAAELNTRFGTKPLQSRVSRIISHFHHLGDEWNGTMRPHGLKLKEMHGVWRFDV